MRYIKRLSGFFIIILAVVSCQKEYSIENGGIVKRDSLTTGNNCRIQQLIESDRLTSDAEYAYISTYDASKKVSRIEWVDSTVNSTDNIFPVSYQAGRVQVDAGQYFITGADGKVTEFYGYEFPEDNSSEKLKVKYTYNAAGQLAKRTEEYDSLPGVVLYQMDYTYAGANLTRAEIKANTGTAMVRFGVINYEYDAGKTVKNFLFLNALAPELQIFQNAINTGTSSTNPVIKTTSIYTNPLNGTSVTFVANFTKYSIDANNYVKSFELTGDDFDEARLYAGKKYNLNYTCF